MVDIYIINLKIKKFVIRHVKTIRRFQTWRTTDGAAESLLIIFSQAKYQLILVGEENADERPAKYESSKPQEADEFRS